MSRRPQIGFNQRIQLAWLERASTLALAGSTRAEALAALRSHLRDQISVGGDAQRSNREKAITILLNTWVSVPEQLQGLRDEGLAHLRRLPTDAHLPIHWGMSMAAYPFFGSVAEVVGRLVRLQGSVHAAQAQRRMREQLGERETVARATRRVLRCFIDWDVLEDTEQKGAYRPAPPRPLDDKQLAAWLVEAALRASRARSGSLKAVAHSPALFPFTLAPVGLAQVRDNGRLEYFRQGLDDEMIILRAEHERS